MRDACKHDCRLIREGFRVVKRLPLPGAPPMSLSNLHMLPPNFHFSKEDTDPMCMLLDRGETTSDVYAFRRAGGQHVTVARNAGLVIHTLLTMMCVSKDKLAVSKIARARTAGAPLTVTDLPVGPEDLESFVRHVAILDGAGMQWLSNAYISLQAYLPHLMAACVGLLTLLFFLIRDQWFRMRGRGSARTRATNAARVQRRPRH